MLENNTDNLKKKHNSIKKYKISLIKSVPNGWPD